MSEIIGKQIEMGVGVEETSGTPQGTAEHWLKKISATVIERADVKSDESTRGRVEDSLGARVVRKWIEGDLEGNVHADSIGYLLYNLYGAVSSLNVAGSVYSHTFSVANTITHASLTLFAHDGANSKERFSNAMLSSMSISAVVDDYIKFTASWMAKDATTSTDTPSYSTEYDFIGKDLVLKIADTEVGLSGATATKVKEVTINYDTGLISDHILGAYAPDDIYNAMMSVEVELTLNYEDDTFKDLYLADTYKYAQVVIVGAADIGGGNNPEMILTLHRVRVIDWSRDDSAGDLVTQTVTLKAYYNETDTKQSEMVLQNLTSEYDSPISA